MQLKYQTKESSCFDYRCSKLSFAVATTAAVFLTPVMVQAIDVTFDSARVVPYWQGDTDAPLTESATLTVTQTGSISSTDPNRPNSIRFYMGLGANFSLNNSGLLEGDWGVFAQSLGTGDVTIDNTASGEIYGGSDYAVYAISNTGNVAINNAGQMFGSAEYGSEDYAGVVGMESFSGGNISFNNSGLIQGKQFQGKSAAVVTASTSGLVNIKNTGRIEAFGGENSASGYSGTGIYVASNVTGGTVANTDGGTINVGASGSAIMVEGRNVTVDLRGSGDIIGSVVLAGGGRNNSLVLDSNGVNLNGNLMVGSGNTMALNFTDPNAMTPFLNATGVINLGGSSLNIGFDPSQMEVGQSYFLLHADGGIYGWLASINGQDTGGIYDPNQIYQFGGYEVSLELANGNTDLMLNVLAAVPEPASYAMLFGAVTAAAVLIRRRRAAKI